MATTIIQPKLLVVEGKDEQAFFTQLLLELELTNIQIHAAGGKTRFRDRLEALVKGPGHETLTSLGVVRDADTNPVSAFDSICGTLRELDLAVPATPLQTVGEAPRVTVMILPNAESEGMLEDLCLASMADDPAMICIEAYFDCLKKQIAPENFPRNPAKARLRAFLSAMEWCEEAYFESIQEYLRVIPPASPAAAQTHAILASRYKPDLDLGLAAQAGYWPLEHSVFDQVKQFLRAL